MAHTYSNPLVTWKIDCLIAIIIFFDNIWQLTARQLATADCFQSQAIVQVARFTLK